MTPEEASELIDWAAGHETSVASVTAAAISQTFDGEVQCEILSVTNGNEILTIKLWPDLITKVDAICDWVLGIPNEIPNEEPGRRFDKVRVNVMDYHVQDHY